MDKISLRKIIKYFGIFLVIFLADRISKIYILSVLESSGEVNIYINSYINLILVWNSGIGFGLLSFDKSAIYNSDLIIIHTEWNDFKSINFKTMVKNKKFVIFDMRNIYSPLKMERSNIKYFSVGR